MKKVILFVALFVVCGFIGYFAARDYEAPEPTAPVIYKPSPTRTPTPEPTKSYAQLASEHYYAKEDYKDLCTDYEYEDLARNNDLVGEYVSVYGKVGSISNQGSFYVLMVYITPTDIELDIWDGQIYVEYVPSQYDDNILTDDKVTVYGQYYGMTTYETVLGANNTVPAIKAQVVDIG